MATTMWKQTTIFGEEMPMDQKDPELPPEGACDEACYFAGGERCSCKCGGAYHGLGRLNRRESEEQKEQEEEL